MFVDFKSKSGYKPDKDIEVKPTVYVLKGKTKSKIEIKFKDINYCFSILLTEGDININFPFFCEGKIQDFIEISFYA